MYNAPIGGPATYDKDRRTVIVNLEFEATHDQYNELCQAHDTQKPVILRINGSPITRVQSVAIRHPLQGTPQRRRSD